MTTWQDPFSEAMERIMPTTRREADRYAARRRRAARHTALRKLLAGPGFGRWVDRGLYLVCFAAIVGTAGLVLTDGLIP